jgi:CBS domain-containing protein
MLKRTISDFIAERELPAVGPEDDVGRAVAVMMERGSDCVLVIDGTGRLLGVFTERDFLNRVAAAGRPVAGTPITEVMTADPMSLAPEDPIAYAINRMAVGGYRNVPIVDPEGRAIANLTVRDVIAHLGQLFDELEELEDDPAAPEWTDLGGGG